MEKRWKELHRKLIIKAFAKAEQELIAENHINPSNHKKAEHLSFCLSEDYNYSYTYKSLVNLLKQATNKQEEVIIKKPEITHLLSQYLGFDDFAAFSKSIEKQIIDDDKVEEIKTEADPHEEAATNPISKNLKGFKIYIAILVVVVLGILAAFQFYGNDEDQRWLRWSEDHYEEVVFNKADFKNGDLKLYDPELLEFRKIKVDSNTEFFDSNGVPIVWYFKHASGTVEFYEAYGLHPIQNKYVKPVTTHIINKYVRGNP
jgi:hypothetical protein